MRCKNNIETSLQNCIKKNVKNCPFCCVREELFAESSCFYRWGKKVMGVPGIAQVFPEQ